MSEDFYTFTFIIVLEVKVMATLLEEEICIIKDKKVAERFLRDLESAQVMDLKEIHKRAQMARKMLEESEKWLEKMQL